MYQRMTQGVMKDKATGEYIKSDIEYIMRTSDKAVFPCVPENKDYQQYLDDLKTKVSVTDFDYAAEESRQVTESAIASAGQEKEVLIQEKLKEIAIAELIADGVLVADKQEII